MKYSLASQCFLTHQHHRRTVAWLQNYCHFCCNGRMFWLCYIYINLHTKYLSPLSRPSTEHALSTLFSFSFSAHALLSFPGRRIRGSAKVVNLTTKFLNASLYRVLRSGRISRSRTSPLSAKRILGYSVVDLVGQSSVAHAFQLTR